MEIDHLDHNLRFGDAVQDLYSTGPTQEANTTAVDNADDTALNPQHELQRHYVRVDPNRSGILHPATM